MADDKLKGEDGKTGEKKGKPRKKPAEPLQVVEEMDDGAPQTISLVLAVGFIVGALVVGLIVGYVVAPKQSSLDGPDQFGTAPQLSPQQLQQGLPTNHPPLPSGSSTGAAGESETGTAGEADTGTEQPAQDEAPAGN